MKKLIAIVCLTLIIAISLSFVVQKRIAPIADLQAKVKAQYIGNKIMNEILIETLENERIDDLYLLEKDEQGNIIAETTNVMAMNLFKTKLHSELNECFSNISHYGFTIPIGTLVGIDWVNNFGIGIPVSLKYNGTIAVDIKNDFTSAGINQTKHTSVLVAKAEVIAVISGRQTTCTINNEIPIAEVIILGNVPNSYLNFGSQR